MLGYRNISIVSDYKRLRIGRSTAFFSKWSCKSLAFAILFKSASGASFLSPAINTTEMTKNNGMPIINVHIPIDQPLNRYSANISVMKMIAKKTTMRMIPNHVRITPQISSSSDLPGEVEIISTELVATKRDHHLLHFRVITRYALGRRFENQLLHCRRS